MVKFVVVEEIILLDYQLNFLNSEDRHEYDHHTVVHLIQ